ncbi:MAG TPA: hypothetical protein VH478_07250, partial [Trebonia sp.]|nr:hypothetical protein [Trebonia sp.]
LDDGAVGVELQRPPLRVGVGVDVAPGRALLPPGAGQPPGAQGAPRQASLLTTSPDVPSRVYSMMPPVALLAARVPLRASPSS